MDILACSLASWSVQRVDIIWSARVYQTLQSEFDHLGIPCFYDTTELSVLGHCLPASLSVFFNSQTLLLKNFDLVAYFEYFHGQRLP